MGQADDIEDLIGKIWGGRYQLLEFVGRVEDPGSASQHLRWAHCAATHQVYGCQNSKGFSSGPKAVLELASRWDRLHSKWKQLCELLQLVRSSSSDPAPTDHGDRFVTPAAC